MKIAEEIEKILGCLSTGGKGQDVSEIKEKHPEMQIEEIEGILNYLVSKNLVVNVHRGGGFLYFKNRR